NKNQYYNIVYLPIGHIDPLKDLGQALMPEEDSMTGRSTQLGTHIYTTNNAKDLESFVASTKDFSDKMNESSTNESFTFINVVSDLDSAKAASESVVSISNLANIIFYVLIVLSVIVLSLIITLSIRDRRHEFGIYMALGEKKYKSIAQVLLESIFVGILAFSIAFGIGALVKDNIANKIIVMPKNNIVQGGPSVGDYINNGEYIGSDYIINNYQIKIGVSQVATIYFIAIITLSIATIIPIVYIQRLNPKEILM
ncbi:MAG: FtsX-like permease family protein, partial [Bacilli bacterium]